MSKENIPPDGLLGQLFDGYRQSLANMFRQPEKQALAGVVFDAYRKAGGNLGPYDFKRLKDIVDEYGRPEGGGEQKAIEAVTIFVRACLMKIPGKPVRPLPRKGRTSPEPGGSGGLNRRKNRYDEAQEETEELLLHEEALKPAKLPEGLDKKISPPKSSGITLLREALGRTADRGRKPA